MSSHYNTEPPPTASATLHTTVGPIDVSLFARQTPLACKNFLQHCLDGYYAGTTFHRIVPSFIVQGGDPTGTGSGGASIYEDPEFELDYSREREHGEKVVFKDEIHSRLRFNRRGLLGMAKSEDGSYGSQFFVTLGPAERELTGKCTLFGRVEGDSIYNIVKISEGELVEGTERPAFAVKVTGSEVGELGPFKDLRKREKIAAPQKEEEPQAVKKKEKKKKKPKGGKALLSFAGDEDEEETELALPAKDKFNTKIVAWEDIPTKSEPQPKKEKGKKEESQQPPESPSKTSRKRSRSHEPSQSQSPPINRKPSRDPNTQVPLPDPESPSRSPSPSTPRSPNESSLSRMNAEIASVKASMRRDAPSASAEPPRKKTALESLIPETSIRGRRRRGGGDKHANGIKAGGASKEEDDALRMFNAFKTKLETADTGEKSQKGKSHTAEVEKTAQREPTGGEADEGEEEQLCDLHFIANCQSCRNWDDRDPTNATTTDAAEANDDSDADWMSHRLTFARDTLGKDLSWKREHEDADGLVVIDPRQKEKNIIGGGGSGRKRERERKRKMESDGKKEWDQRGASGKRER